MRADCLCPLGGDYVDEAEVPADVAYSRGEVVRPQFGGTFFDLGAADEPDEDPTIQTLLRIIQAETHGPSRARMVESIVRLEALALCRTILDSERSSEFQRNSACQAIGELFGHEAARGPLPRSPNAARS